MDSRFNDLFDGADIKFEDVINKTRDAAEIIGKKGAERLELSKKRVEYFDAKSKLNKQYEKYGRLNYKRFLGNELDDYEFAACEAKIAELNDKIEILSQDIEAAKKRFNDSVASATQKAQKTYEEIKKDVEKNSSVEKAVDIEVEDI